MKCSENIFIVGKCERFCSLSEEKLRKTENLLNYYERNGQLVAEFKRSAADRRQAKPEELRTFGALKKTLDYLISRILLDEQRPLNFRYDFIFDRCRAIRQEIVVQNFDCAQTLKLLEPQVLFLSYSLYRMNNLPISHFDSKICKQHLQECSLKCLTCYDELEMQEGSKKGHNIQSRQIIESIYMMQNVNQAGTLERAMKFDINLKASCMVKLSINILISYHQREFYKLFQDIPKLPHPIVCAIASLQLCEIRKEVLRVFSIAYNSQSLKVPLTFLQRLLVYDDPIILIEHLRANLGILDAMPANDDNEAAIRFDRKKFDIEKSLPSIAQQFVDEKLRGCHLPDLILLDSF